jgi:hypothetical protein
VVKQDSCFERKLKKRKVREKKRGRAIKTPDTLIVLIPFVPSLHLLLRVFRREKKMKGKHGDR